MTTSQEAADHAVRWATEADRRIRDAQEHHEKSRDLAGEVMDGWRWEQQRDMAQLELVLAERARLQALMWVQVEPLLPAAIEAPGVRTRCTVCGCIDAVCANCRRDCAQVAVNGSTASPEVAV